MERLVANLFDNALRHNLTGGYVNVATRTESGHAIFTITNSGPSIPHDEIDRLFQPFQRLNSDRAHHPTGLGLGLSIVHAVATAHGATITVSPGGRRAQRRSDLPPMPIDANHALRNGLRAVGSTHLPRRRSSLFPNDITPDRSGGPVLW